MKNKICLYIFALLSLAFSACVDEVIVDNGSEEWQPGDTPYYVNLRLKTISETFTRSDNEEQDRDNFANFTDGLHAYEHAISPNAYNFAIFFDSAGKYIACADLYSVNESAGHVDAEVDGSTGEINSPQTESTYTCRFYGFAENKPAKVLVVVNSPKKIYDSIGNFPGWNIEEVMKRVWNEPGTIVFDSDGKIVYNSDGSMKFQDDSDPRNNLGFYVEGNGSDRKLYFTMTNSTYVKGYPENPKLYCAQDIPSSCITTDPTAVTDLEPVTVYLERMVSKFQLSTSFDAYKYNPVNAQPLDVCIYEYNDETGEESFQYKDYSWNLELLSWGVNGLETSNYIFKNVPVEVSGNEILDWLNQEGWNSTYNRRCFWSQDPHYFKDNTNQVVYPWQFDDAKDQYNADQQTWYNHFQSYDRKSPNFSSTSSFALTYYPFKHFCPDVSDDGEINAGHTYKGDTYTFYSPENTFVPGMQVDRSQGTRAYELAGTHLILCARLLIDPEGGTDYKPYSGNIYRNRVGVTYIDELSMLEDFMNAVNYKLTSQKYMYYKYYPWDESEQGMSSIKRANPENYYGHTMRAMVEGKYALYCYFEDENRTIELTPGELKKLTQDRDKYRLYREADAINADGKIIPWIRYNKNATGKEEDFKNLRLLILLKNDDATDPSKSWVNIDPVTKAEIITGNPDDKTTIPGSNGSTTYHDYYQSRRLEFQKNNGAGGWQSYVDGERDDNDIQSLFYEIWGIADNFYKGLMYYAVPIYAQDKNGRPVISNVTTLDDMSSGLNDLSFYYYYGVVRNNWYNFTLHSINDIGIPVYNVNKPIVPNYSRKRDQTKMEMEIVGWHIEDITVPIPAP